MHDITVTTLRCEYAENPIGIDTEGPRFYWILESSERAQAQSAYRILVARSSGELASGAGSKWDSGRVESSQSVNVSYEGGALASGDKCWWKVRVWDQDGRESPWSEPATFEMGLLRATDWQGKWIRARSDISAPLFRREFLLEGKVESARIHVAGIGYHELYVNGARVGDHVMDPAPTWYHNVFPFEIESRVLYVTHDVTELVKPGENAVGVMLGHGWYSSDDGHPPGRAPIAEAPALLLQMNVAFADGTTTTLATDESWRTSPGPITANDIVSGERYDARLEQPGWDRPGFDDAEWARAVVSAAPSGRLVAQSVEPIRITQRLKPVRCLKTDRDSWIFDLEQYISGWTQLRVKGPRGTKVTLRHGGRVNYETRALDTRNSMLGGQQALQEDLYTLKGEGVEVWHPRFTVHGFRYVEVIGYPGEPTLGDIEGHVVNSSVETCGTFECSNELLNRIHHNVCWTFRGSLQGIPQDAAERAERLGLLGDPGFVAEDYLYNFNGARFWSKWLDDIADAQKADGSLPYTCPPYWSEHTYRDWPCWECTYALFVWFCYQYYGDERVLTKHYEGLKKQVERFRALAGDLVLDEPLGDHMEPRDDGTSSFTPVYTPPALCGTAYFHFTTRILAQAAAILGRGAEAQKYQALAGNIRDTFNRRFFDPETAQYAGGSQTSNALALYLNLVPRGREDAVLKNLVEDILDRHGGHLSTGIIGTAALEQALPAYGRADVMYGIAAKTTFPSWGYGVVNGQTTISEDFECSPRRSVSMKMFGGIEKFFYKNLAGISPASPGYRAISVRPQVIGGLKHASASIRTVRGLAAVNWKKSDTFYEMKVTVPGNSRAEICIPKLGLKGIEIAENGKRVWKEGAFMGDVAGIASGAETREYVTFSVGSGSYDFRLVGEK